MAITGPDDLPAVLKIDSEPIKKYVLTKLGHPTVEVELSEDQFETILRTSGDFIAHYLPKEQKLAYFYTQPLKSSYDMPEDAYWVQEVQWDPVTTRIGDVFGAESYLFCFADSTNIIRSDGEHINISKWLPEYMAKTPFGDRYLRLERHDEPQSLVRILYKDGSIECTPNHPFKTNGLDDIISDWECAADCIDHDLVTIDGSTKCNKVEYIEQGPTTTVYALGAHCFYACMNGVPVLVH